LKLHYFKILNTDSIRKTYQPWMLWRIDPAYTRYTNITQIIYFPVLWWRSKAWWRWALYIVYKRPLKDRVIADLKYKWLIRFEKRFPEEGKRLRKIIKKKKSSCERRY
jgi:hypothetical protein